MYSSNDYIPKARMYREGVDISSMRSPYANNLARNPLLPIINTRNQILAEEQYKHVQNSINYVQNRAQRSMKHSLKYNNFPLYDPGIPLLLNNFPQNMYNYRPIRYFFQRPVYVEQEPISPNRIRNIAEIKANNHIADAINKVPKSYAVPLKYDDLVKNGEILNQALGKVVDKKGVERHFKELEMKRVQQDKEKEKAKMRLKNITGTRKKKLKQTVNMLRCFKIYLKLANSLKYIRSNEEILFQNTKTCLDEISNFIGSVIKKEMEEFFKFNFLKKIDLVKKNDRVIQEIIEGIPKKDSVKVENEQKKKTPTPKNEGTKTPILKDDKSKGNENNQRFENEDTVDESIFRLKKALYTIMNVLSNAMGKKESIPGEIRRCIKLFVSEGAIVPKNFLTTLEFNRLEWNIRVMLSRMSHERKSMLVGTLVFFRILILTVLRNYQLFFPDLKNISDPSIPDIQQNLSYNFNLFGYVLAKAIIPLFRKVNIYREYFKEKYLFNHFLLNNEGIKEKILTNDEFELERIIGVNQEAEEFIIHNNHFIIKIRDEFKLLIQTIAENL